MTVVLDDITVLRGINSEPSVRCLGGLRDIQDGPCLQVVTNSDLSTFVYLRNSRVHNFKCSWECNLVIEYLPSI